MCLCHNSQWEMIINLLPYSWGELSRQTVITIVISTLLAWSGKIVVLVGQLSLEGTRSVHTKHVPGSLATIGEFGTAGYFIPLTFGSSYQWTKTGNIWKDGKFVPCLKMAAYWHALSSGQLNGHKKANGLFLCMCCILFICLLSESRKETLKSYSVCTQCS